MDPVTNTFLHLPPETSAEILLAWAELTRQELARTKISCGYHAEPVAGRYFSINFNIRSGPFCKFFEVTYRRQEDFKEMVMEKITRVSCGSHVRNWYQPSYSAGEVEMISKMIDMVIARCDAMFKSGNIAEHFE